MGEPTHRYRLTAKAAAMVVNSSVQLIHKSGPSHTGIGRYVFELERGLAERAVDHVRVPLQSPVPRVIAFGARRVGYDLDAFFASYPLRAQTSAGSLTHLTSQTLGALLLTQHLPRPVVATVHDILPYLLRHDPQLSVYRTRAQRLMDALAMRGLKRADRLIANSHYTKATLIDALGVDDDCIDVVHLGVDCQRYRPERVSASFRTRYSLPDDRPYLLYVGSEDPRKNLGLLLRAFARVRNEIPDATLLKVGAPAFEDQRQANLRICSELGIRDGVRFFDDVAEDDLPSFYRLASVFAFPSLHEGFGFPVLEALACGTAVVAADSSSIPELVGNEARLVDGRSVDSFAPALIETIRKRSGDFRGCVNRAAGFTWSRTMEGTLNSYEKAEARCRAKRSSEKRSAVARPQRVDQ
jgi:glycosyltransferase involved in cell wall biosynthesis